MAVKIIYDKKDWQSLADCIRSDQVPVQDLILILEQSPNFAKWYKKKYLDKVYGA